MIRADSRSPSTLRPVRLEIGVQEYPLGSAEIWMGRTRVLCAASLEERVPPFLKNTGRGWVTAEYSMLPSATNVRAPREAQVGRLSGRTQEIQRLIGRSLRAVTPLGEMGERMLTIDCDVIQADGGTRTAAITGGYVALAMAIRRLVSAGTLPESALPAPVAAVSVGIVDGSLLLDLAYDEDKRAEADVNVVMTGDLRLVEVQGTAEAAPFRRDQFDALLDLAASGIRQLLAAQQQALTRVYDGLRNH